MDLSILGIGIVSALGCGIDSLKRGLEGVTKPDIREEESIKFYKADIIGLDRFVSEKIIRRLGGTMLDRFFTR